MYLICLVWDTVSKEIIPSAIAAGLLLLTIKYYHHFKGNGGEILHTAVSKTGMLLALIHIKVFREFYYRRGSLAIVKHCRTWKQVFIESSHFKILLQYFCPPLSNLMSLKICMLLSESTHISKCPKSINKGALIHEHWRKVHTNMSVRVVRS